ncbi:MAG: hypothetical protein PWP65_1903 [Clostridia bacterium]|nr:hypothetical protein [Clostridia bacterium]
MSKNDFVFALDVGTRKVAGLILEERPGGKGYKIKAAEIIEHRQRAMLDGQIHDIPQVAETILQVKERLEKRLKLPLKEAAVAAAGRALKTQRASFARQISPAEEINREVVLALEASAVQEAQKLLLGGNEKVADYYCVGYSVTGYFLDSSPIGNLIGQRGNEIGAEVIATFLPRVVVDSLTAALQRAGLSMTSLTLEPIAASTVAVPPEMRGLNLALVDIGAGTSDIAISGGGTIIGYAMVPFAGDEITEKLANALLLDFPTAEKVKRELNTSPEVAFVDIVGNCRRISSQEVMETIRDSVGDLARQIAEQIILLNGRPPQAVILIGGGSLTPGLPATLAGYLELSPERVAVRGREVLNHITGAPRFNGPQAITSIGIAVTAWRNEGMGYASIQVNGRPVRYLATQEMTVAGALLAAGIPIRSLHGRPGPGLGVEVNGKLVFLRGRPGQPGGIKLNGQPCGLETKVRPGDIIEVTPGRDGDKARGVIRDILPEPHEKHIIFNGNKMLLTPQVTYNGQPANLDTPLEDKARITYQPFTTVGDVLAYLGYPKDTAIWLNGLRVRPEALVKDGDRLDTSPRPAQTLEIFCNGRKLHIEAGNGPVLFTDLFKYLDFTPTPPPGKKRLVMELNGQAAEFTSPLKNGDRVTLMWE